MEEKEIVVEEVKEEEPKKKKSTFKSVSKKLLKKRKVLSAEFKKFITRGNVMDMAVGVVIGASFNAIVTSLVKILTSLATFFVPNGINGLISVLPAVNDSQKGLEGIGQFFESAQLKDMTIAYAASQGAEITAASDSFTNWQSTLLGMYKLYGTTYVYNQSVTIEWGTLINAIISFIIVANTLFIIVKVYNYLQETGKGFAKKIGDKTMQIIPDAIKKLDDDDEEEETK